MKGCTTAGLQCERDGVPTLPPPTVIGSDVDGSLRCAYLGAGVEHGVIVVDVYGVAAGSKEIGGNADGAPLGVCHAANEPVLA